LYELSRVSRAKLLKISKDKDLPMFSIQSCNGAPNNLCHFRASERLVGRFAGSSKAIEVADRQTDRAAFLAAKGLKRFIDGHASHPRTKAGF